MGKHRRFFLEPSRIDGQDASIVGDAAHQIATVLRLKVGDRIVLLDGSGSEHEAEIAQCSRHEVRARILRTSACNTEPKLNLTLAICLPKGDKLDSIVQKCTELGISRIVIVSSERTVRRVEPARAADKLTRWKRIAVEAAEQSGRAASPDIQGVISYEELLAQVSSYGLVVLAWEDEQHQSLKDVLKGCREGDSVMLIVGPEGGLAEREAEMARRSGAQCVSLGKRTLRSETAAIAGCAAILYEIEGEL